jgi:prepilin-type N-terminal cleavage/methylation domain-containing protein
MTIKNSKKGFSLVELLVSLAIFSIVLSAALTVFASNMRSQRKVLEQQEIIGEMSYAFERMSRALRMAKKDFTGSCIGANYNYLQTARGIKFLDYRGDCLEFYLDGADNRIKEVKNAGAAAALTSPNIRVTQFILGPSDSWSQYDLNSLQPAVTIFSAITTRDGTKINFQTTISQRNLDFQY